MNFQKYSLIIIVAIVVITGTILFIRKPNSQVKLQITPTLSPIISQTPTSTPTATIIVTKPTPTPTESKYSAATKAKVRSDFIASCISKGHYSSQICNCVADYLKNNYTEVELAKIYVQYHSTSQVPAVLETGLNKCLGK
jgi:hypothetical protein